MVAGDLFPHTVHDDLCLTLAELPSFSFANEVFIEIIEISNTYGREM
jgi:hypothetical protein